MMFRYTTDSKTTSLSNVLVAILVACSLANLHAQRVQRVSETDCGSFVSARPGRGMSLIATQSRLVEFCPGACFASDLCQAFESPDVEFGVCPSFLPFPGCDSM